MIYTRKVALLLGFNQKELPERLSANVPKLCDCCELRNSLYNLSFEFTGIFHIFENAKKDKYRNKREC